MSYQLRNGETLGDNLSRICRKQIEAAICVAKDEVKTDDTPVHEMRKHLKNPSAENFHGFRTRAKTLWYQLRILRPVNPVVLKSLADDLRSLADLLGRAHDLSFLGARLRNEHGKSQWQREGHKLLAIIEVSQ